MSDDISIGKIVDIWRSWEDYKSTSLPQYTKRCLVGSRVYIQNEVAEDPIMSDLLKTIQSVYIGYILTAVQMNTYVSHNRTVRDLMSTVATENLKGDLYVGTESIAADFAASFNPKMYEPKNDYDRKHSLPTPGGKSGTKILDVKDISFPAGKVVEVSFASPVDPKATFNVNIFVQLLPRIIPYEVAEQFIALNFTPSLKQRWLQYKVGEINFWHDFVGQLDLLKKRRVALKKDSTGDLKNMMDLQQNALTRQLLKLFRIFPDMQNVANSILIYDKEMFDKFCHDNHYDFRRYGDRQSFFNKAFAMAIATIDTRYNRVEMYLNGIEAKCDYTYAQLVTSAKRDNLNLVTMMGQMSQGQAPRF